MAESYKYFAFISFQSADAKEAVRLQHAIESYRLPAVLCKHANLPRRVRPLYCYLNDIHSGEELMMELKQRIEQSRYLIVVCSPRSAKSTYVNSGIDYFISLGRRDSIIPVIVDGIPYSGDERTECFPEALIRHFPKHPDPLQDHSILGINIREAGISRHKAYDRAMLMVVARMLQLDFDGLLLREKQRRRRKAILLSLLSLIIVFALCLTWYLSQTVNVTLQISEGSDSNAALPQCNEVVVRMALENELKTDTIYELGKQLVFPNIPPRFIGKNVRLTVQAKDYLPCDTSIILERQQTIYLYRDMDIYGHVHFHVVGDTKPLQIAGYTVVPDDKGAVDISIPMSEQRTSYLVMWKDGCDTLYMPCGTDDVIVLEP